MVLEWFSAVVFTPESQVYSDYFSNTAVRHEIFEQPRLIKIVSHPLHILYHRIFDLTSHILVDFFRAL